jgi:hypothetical protein
MPPTLIPANAPGKQKHALLALVALMQNTDAAFAACSPSSAAGGHAVTIGGWAVAVDASGPPSREFGRHANCNALARCLNCMPACPAEAQAADLSARAGGCAALMVEADGRQDGQALVTARTYLPGSPGLSDMWFLTLCPVTGGLRLVATNGGRSALLGAGGQLTVASAVPIPEVTLMAATVFWRMWMSTITAVRLDHQHGQGANASLMGNAA